MATVTEHNVLTGCSSSERTYVLSEDLKCSICLNVYDDPRMLPCLHSYCCKCIIPVIEGEAVKCPQCRSDHILPSSGVVGLIHNTNLSKRVEKLSINNTSALTCGVCQSTAQAVSFCLSCNQYLCTLCDESHKRMSMFKTHALVPPEKAKQTSRPTVYKCPKHPDEALKVYCIKCEEVICRDCALYHHQRHSFKPAEEAADEIKMKLKAIETTTTEKLVEFSKHTQTISDYETYVTTSPDQLKAHITNFFDTLLHKLGERKVSLLCELDTQFNSFSKHIWAEKSSVEMTVCGLEASLKFAKQVMESSEKIEIAVLGAKAFSQMKMINKKSWSADNLEIITPVCFLENDVTSLKTASVRPVESIQQIGCLKAYGADNLCIILQPLGYEGSISSRGSKKVVKNIVLQFGCTYCVNVKVDAIATIIFPQINIKQTVMQGNNNITSRLAVETDQKVWMLSFKTDCVGQYIIEVSIAIYGTVSKQTLKLHFLPCQRRGIHQVQRRYYYSSEYTQHGINQIPIAYCYSSDDD